MKIRILVYAVVLTCCSLLLSRQGRAQGSLEFRTPGSDSVKVVLIHNTDNFRSETKDSATMTFLVGNVRLKEGNTLIYCDSMVRNSKDNILESFGHVHINDNDSTDIYSDYMRYEVVNRTVYFQKNVKMTDGKGVLTTEELQYDLNKKVGVYVHGGKIVNKESVLTSEEGTYFEDTKDVHFKKNVVLKDPQYDLTADSLLYNTQTQLSTFITETFIQFKDSSQRTVRTSSGYYDLKNKKAYFGKRPVIKDGSQQITGETVTFDDSTGVNTAKGNAVYKDTAQGFVLTSGYMTTNKKSNTFLATEHPLMTLKQDKDSIYIVADTLISGRLVDQQAFERRMEIEDSLHKIYVDSLYRRSSDSLHRAAMADTSDQQDTLISVTDSTHHQVIKDLSDSIGRKHPVPADSLGAADSLGTKHGLDSLTKKHIADSLGKKATDTSGKKLSRRELKRKAKEEKRLQREQEDTRKAALKATADSISHRAKVIKDSTARKAKAMADSVSKKERAIKDSVERASRPPKHVSAKRALADSLRAARFAARQRRVDSLRMDVQQRSMADSLKKAVSDSLQRKTQDSLRQKTADSVKAVKAAEKAAAVVKDTSLRYLKGYHHVRIYSDSLQAIGDSLYYTGKDSIFRLFYNPIAWGNGGYQVTGDTMYVYTKNKKASRLYVFENALALNRVAKNFYNQLKGTTINAYFKDGQVDYMRSKGNAESIYYVRDDNKAYTGVNKAHADVIDMIFGPKEEDSTGKERELNRVVMRNDVEGSFIPFKKVVFDDMRLRGFKWHEDLRPKSKEDLIKGKSAIVTDDLDKLMDSTDKAANKPAQPAKGNLHSINVPPPIDVDPLPINPELLLKPAPKKGRK